MVKARNWCPRPAPRKITIYCFYDTLINNLYSHEFPSFDFWVPFLNSFDEERQQPNHKLKNQLPIRGLKSYKLKTKPIPLVPYRFISHIDTALMQKVFYIPWWKRKSRIQHHCKWDDLRAGFELTKWYMIGQSSVFCQYGLAWPT